MADYLWLDLDDLPSGWDKRFTEDVKYIRWDIVQGAMFLEPASMEKLKKALEASE